MIIEINEKQRLILRDLLGEEIRYLKKEAIPSAKASTSSISKKDVEDLKKELHEVENLYKQIINY